MMPTVPIVGFKPSATQPFENKGNAGVPIVPRVIRAHGRTYKGFFFEWGLKLFPREAKKHPALSALRQMLINQLFILPRV